MESYYYPQFPPECSTVHFALFTDVANTPQLRARLIRAAGLAGAEGEAEREAVNFAFVDARLITSRLHLQTAVYHAILAHLQETLRTKTVHSEVLWNLNPSNNISEAIRRYGVSVDTKSLFVVRVTGAAAESEKSSIKEKMQSVVAGTLVPLAQLQDITDWNSIKKYHKLNTELAIQETTRDEMRQRAVVDEIVTSSVAMKSVMA